ncbi:hypothetical protein F4780DRAFT_123398 [Xylariomycetidae sp. FL0641]|nr:hypothetical protein F4780DRAFT_123398 [Xylariomycetidae sp. FL0641]
MPSTTFCSQGGSLHEPSPSPSPLASEFSNQTPERRGYHYPNHTPDRPPHRNDRNVPPAQVSGAEPRTLAHHHYAAPDTEHVEPAVHGEDGDTGGHYYEHTAAAAASTPTATLRDGEAAAALQHHRRYLDFVVNRDYHGRHAGPPALTESAMAALEQAHRVGAYPGGSVRAWLQGGRPYPAQELTASMEVEMVGRLAARRRRRADTARTLGSSWTVVSSLPRPPPPLPSRFERAAEDVCAAGGRFAELAAAQVFQSVRDEDLDVA